MKRYVIDASRFVSKKDMYEHLHEVLGQEDFAGSNLDALHDRLTMIFEPTVIEVKNYACALRGMEGYANLFWHVLDDASEENRNLTVLFN